MNRKQRIIVSVTGIFLVLLIIVGLTYAYFLTQIKGNTDTTSIVSKTTKLEIEYGDGNGILEPVGVILPGTNISFLDSNGNLVDSKTFTVTNKGNATNYVVLLEDILVKYNKTVGNNVAGSETELNSPNDFKYTLTCKKKNGTNCNSIFNQSFPTEDSVVVSNYIAKSDVHTYTLTMKYIETNIDQSADMNKTMTAKINIDNTVKRNPYTEGTLAYKIIDNAFYASGTNANPESTSLSTGTTIPGFSKSDANERTLNLMQDDYGTSYYYRGKVVDNYVNFAGMCWRIVRIQGDSSIKLILEDQYTTCNDTETTETPEVYTGNWTVGLGNYGFDANVIESVSVYKMNYLNPSKNANSSMIKAFDNFYDTKLLPHSNKLRTGGWCINDVAYKESTGDLNALTPLSDNELNSYYSLTNDTNEFYYDSYIRLYNSDANARNAKLQCSGSVIEDKVVGTLTADEVAYAGGKAQSAHSDFYLVNEYGKNNVLSWWTLSPSMFKITSGGVYADWGYALTYLGNLNTVSNGYVSRSYNFRPAISLLNDKVTVSKGDGTKGNPFVVE